MTNRQVVHTALGKLDKRMVQIPVRILWFKFRISNEAGRERFQHVTQSSIQFKTDKRFISQNFHLMFSDQGWPQVTETPESKTTDGRCAVFYGKSDLCFIISMILPFIKVFPFIISPLIFDNKNCWRDSGPRAYLAEIIKFIPVQSQRSLFNLKSLQLRRHFSNKK